MAFRISRGSQAPASGGERTDAAPAKPRRLVAGHPYFGIEAQALRAGAERVLARLASQRGQARLDVHHLAADFRLDVAAGWTLLRAFVAAGIVKPAEGGGYRPTARMREYATAQIVAPLSRTRAKELIGRARDLAETVNADWRRNPFTIRLMAVSGSYMSRRREMTELPLWLVVRPRPQPGTRRWTPPLPKGDALRQILEAVGALSSFVVVRIAPDKRALPRPFSVVFDAGEPLDADSTVTWSKLRSWSVSIGRRLGGSDARSR